jgi:hypothetical protein
MRKDKDLDTEADEVDWPEGEPDKIEQEVIRVVSSIPEQAENWIDNRSSLTRLRQKWLSKDADALRDQEIKEKWTKQIVVRLVELGKRLRYRVDDSHSVDALQ